MAPDTYPEIDFNVSTASKLSVADLEGYGHLVPFPQSFVKTFPRMGAKLYVVGRGQGDK